MSKISDLRTGLVSLIETALPTHKELNNPYFPESDSELSYDAAFGVGYAEGANQDTNPESGQETRQRNFIVTLTRRNFGKKRDADTRESTADQLMEDWTLFVNSLAEKPRLGNPSLAQRVYYINDNGIEFLQLEKQRQNILLIRTIVEANYEVEVQAPC